MRRSCTVISCGVPCVAMAVNSRMFAPSTVYASFLTHAIDVYICSVDRNLLYPAGITCGALEWGNKASRFLKAEPQRAGIGYRELAEG